MIKKSLISIGLIVLSLHTHAEIGEHQSRDGTLQIKENPTTFQETLYYNNKIVEPKVEGNNSLSAKGPYKLKSDDIFLIEDHGGTVCPIQLNFVKITPAKKVVVSPIFGSCSDLIKVSKTKDHIIVNMPDYAGGDQSDEDKEKTARKKMTYIYDGTTITENGKLVDSRERW